MDRSCLVPLRPDCTQPIDGRRLHLHARASSHKNEHVLKPWELVGYDTFLKTGSGSRHQSDKEHSRLTSIASNKGPRTLDKWWRSDEARTLRLKVGNPSLTEMSHLPGSTADVGSAVLMDTSPLDKLSSGRHNVLKSVGTGASTFDPSLLPRRERIAWLESLELEAGRPNSCPAGGKAGRNGAQLSNRHAVDGQPDVSQGSQRPATTEVPRLSGSNKLAMQLQATPRAKPQPDAADVSRWQPRPKPNTSSCLSELAQAVAQEHVNAEQLRQCTRMMATWSYELPIAEALRAMTLLSKGAKKLNASKEDVSRVSPLESHKHNLFGETVAEEMRAAVYTIEATVSATIAVCDLQSTVDALTEMAETRLARQELLDSLLAHLMTLMRRNVRDFKPPVLARIMGALGEMKSEGGFDGESLCASAGSTAGCAAANQRFLGIFNAWVYQVQLDFLEADIGDVHEAYVEAYLNEEQIQKFLWRAAQLQVGLLEGSAKYLSLMQRIQRTAMTKFPLIESGLKPLALLYCKRLLAADTGESPQLDRSPWRYDRNVAWRYHGNVGTTWEKCLPRTTWENSALKVTVEGRN